MSKPILHLVPQTKPLLRLVPKAPPSTEPERLSGGSLFATTVAVTVKAWKLHPLEPALA
ncbi:hypothetical protein EC845_0467 [Comamonas sp. BIGb0124]|uniref:hypothetical protein n=1 Tax=Comamonas sp. BIGb0124 TaxID=2485130 RepID=UPI000F9E09A2|nr:hypothetical protein [Comamonas sp. BIGb0124]ROR24442.1 hypothetical protein EC845_0467 [Comamonas sp. BIGb0124]